MADNKNMTQEEIDNGEEMTVTLTLDDGREIECVVLTIFPAGGKDYIALLPMDDIEAEDGEVYLYRYSEDENGQPCAYCLLALTWSNEAGGLCVWLEEIMVDDEQRGKGIGSRIIAAVHEKYNTAARYRLEVTESNVRASALYHMLGFEDLEYRQMILDTPPLG